MLKKCLDSHCLVSSEELITQLTSSLGLYLEDEMLGDGETGGTALTQGISVLHSHYGQGQRGGLMNSEIFLYSSRDSGTGGWTVILLCSVHFSALVVSFQLQSPSPQGRRKFFKTRLREKSLVRGLRHH